MSHSYNHHHRQSSSSIPMTISVPSMMSLSSSSTHDRCEELRKRIHDNHLSYLNREETPAKLETRTKIECLIAEYLSLVPHTHKFSYVEVANCLDRSIVENAEFSAYKAAGAFEALEKYSTNLLNHPWRKEYHTICPYGGFYRHVIQKMLIGAEQIICLMGFEYNTTKGCFQLIDDFIDPDKVSLVSLECLVAFVECQIMIQIRETLKSKGYTDCTWSEIHSIRTEYVCGQADVVKLICEKRKTAKLIDYDGSGSTMNTKKLTPIIVGNSHWSSNGYSLIDDKLPSNKSHHYHGKCSSIDYIYDDDDATESFDLLNYPIIDHHSYPIASPCHYCLPHSNSLPSQHSIPYITPTLFAPFPHTAPSHISVAPKVQTASKGIQAEVQTDPIESSFSKLSLQSKKSILSNDVIGGHSSSHASKSILSNDVGGHSSHASSSHAFTSSASSQTRKDSASNANRNIVHKSVEKRGSFYDNLDPLISLDSVVFDSKSLESNDNKKQSESKKSPTPEKSKQNTSLEKKIKTSSLEKDKKKGLGLDGSISKIVNSIKPQSSSSKNHSPSLVSNAVESKAHITQQLTSSVQIPSTTISNSTVNNTKTKSECNNKEGSVMSDRWACLSCTYINGSSRDVCEICHRSRKSGNESTPLVSGGRECPRCTLVNGKDEKFCTACDTSLADSPTYI